MNIARDHDFQWTVPDDGEWDDNPQPADLLHPYPLNDDVWLLCSHYDMFRWTASSNTLERLTKGEENGIRFRTIRSPRVTDGAPDPNQRIFFTVFDTNTKAGGFAALDPNANSVKILRMFGKRLFDYDATRKYPMVVYIYERQSDDLHVFSRPNSNRVFDAHTLCSQGYFVYQPDIAYQLGEPAACIKVCVESATNAVIAKGVVDPDRIGLMGSSCGGYETLVVMGGSKIFAAAAALESPTNHVRAFGGLQPGYRSTGRNHVQFAQGRMAKPLWHAARTISQLPDTVYLLRYWQCVCRTPLIRGKGRAHLLI